MDPRNAIIREHMPVVHRLAHRYVNTFPSLDRDDLVQEGTLGILHAQKVFDPARGSFKVVVFFAVRTSMLTHVRQQLRLAFPFSQVETDENGRKRRKFGTRMAVHGDGSVHSGLAIEGEPDASFTQLESSAPSPEELVFDLQLEALVRRAAAETYKNKNAKLAHIRLHHSPVEEARRLNVSKQAIEFRQKAIVDRVLALL